MDSTVPISSDAAFWSTHFMLHMPIGLFLIILLLVIELVVRPIQELYKDTMLHCASRRALAEGQAVRIRSAPFALRALGIDTLVSGRHCTFQCAQITKIAIGLLLIVVLALFERSVDGQKRSVVTQLSTTSVEALHIQVPEGRTVLMSPFPPFGVSEEDAVDIRAFSPTGANSSSNYVAREDPNLAAQFISSCVVQVNDSYTNVYVGALVLNNGVQTVQCLDGTSNSNNRSAALFFSNPPESHTPFVQRVTLSRLRNEKGFSSDTVTGVFAAEVTDENGDVYRGYVAVTKRSHYNSNVVWSMYGLVRSDGPFIHRLSIPLYSIETDSQDVPCFDHSPFLNYVGEWTFRESDYICPDGFARRRDRERNEELQTVQLQIFPVSQQVAPEEDGDLLSWLLETDYARFVSAQTFATEIRTRVRSDRMFYSLHDGEMITAKNGEVEDVVVIGAWQTFVLFGMLGFLLLFVVVSLIWKWVQRYSLEIDSDVVSVESIARMYVSQVRQTPYPGRVLAQVGFVDEEYGVPRIGLVEKY